MEEHHFSYNDEEWSGDGGNEPGEGAECKGVSDGDVSSSSGEEGQRRGGPTGGLQPIGVGAVCVNP